MFRKRLNFMFLILSLIISIEFLGCNNVATNTTVKSLKSPNGKYTAVAFVRDAGATTDYSPQVSVIKSTDSFKNETGNAFIGNHSKNIDIKWVDDDNLEITYDCDKSDVYKQEEKINGINIKYIKK